MAYLIKNYVNHVHRIPERWLHPEDKDYVYYDPTNNPSETVNSDLKRNKYSPFDHCRSLLKIVDKVKENEAYAKKLDYNHNYSKSIKCSMKRKENREAEKNESIEKLLKIYRNLENYNSIE